MGEGEEAERVMDHMAMQREAEDSTKAMDNMAITEEGEETEPATVTMEMEKEGEKTHSAMVATEMDKEVEKTLSATVTMEMAKEEDKTHSAVTTTEKQKGGEETEPVAENKDRQTQQMNTSQSSATPTVSCAASSQETPLNSITEPAAQEGSDAEENQIDSSARLAQAIEYNDWDTIESLIDKVHRDPLKVDIWYENTRINIAGVMFDRGWVRSL